MCIIIYNKQDKLKSSVIKEASKSNPDGAGIMYSLNNKLNVFKNRKNGKVIDEYYRIRKLYPNILIVLHFRIATDGGINDKNCHPYLVNDKTALMHNGILTNYCNRNTAMSDTRLFIKDVLMHFDNSVLWTDPMISLIRQAVGYGNKLVLLRNDGTSVILNEHLGHWDKDKENWFSNSSYKEYLVTSLSRERESCIPYTASGWNSKRGEVKPLDNEMCDYCGKMLYSWYERDKHTCTTCLTALNAEPFND